MPRQPQHQRTTKPRRSLRLRKLATAIPAEEEQRDQPPSRSKTSTFNLRELPAELRPLIFAHLVTTERPYLIGRCQEERRKTYGSPRDIISFYNKGAFKVRRDDSRNRPKQPPITRVCRAFRQEALPLWYSVNQFWLIHNEFEPEDEAPNPQRRFDAWLSQTPRDMFNFMERVSLCGYASWPNRIMISLDLKNRRILSIRHYSTYGDELPTDYPSFIDSTERALTSKTNVDGFAALKAVLLERDSLFQISREYVTAPPGMMRREPASGWEYDW